MTSHESRTSDFIGRQPELAVLAGALDDMLSGKGQLVMLAGEPGIGKTRLAHELTDLAGAQNATVLWGWCHERRGAPPYWPWLQALRTYIETSESGQLRQDMGPGAADISEILPELKFKIDGLEGPPALDLEEARFRLYFSITTFLKNISRRQPLVLVLDDLHWADQSSLLLLEFLTREISANSVMVVGTYRDEEVTGSHPLAQTLGSLVREENFKRVQLGGLSRDEVGEFVQARTGIAVTGDAVDSLHQRTEGNPLFVGEVVGSVSPEELDQNQDWIASLPEAVREAILRRLSRLSEPCNQLLRTASVIGRDFDLPLLRALSADISEDDFLGGIDEAMSIRIIESLPARPGRFRFGHALVQQAVYEGIPAMRKVQAHGVIAEQLEQIHQNNLEEHSGELAYHFAQAQTVIGPEKLVRFSTMAGERCLAAHAHDEAMTLFQLGLSAKGEMPVDGESASLLFGLGRAQLSALGRHRIAEAVDNLNRAFDYYAKSGDVERAVAVAEHPVPNVAAHSAGASERIARALTMVPADSPAAGRLLSLFGRVLGSLDGDYEAASDAFSKALAIARSEDDAALELKTLAGEIYVGVWNLRWREVLDKIPRAIELAKTVDDPLGELLTHWGAVSAEMATGHLDAARKHVAEGMILAERLRDRHLVCGTLFRDANASRAAGDWQTARDSTDHGLAILPMDTRLLGGRVLLGFEVGEFKQGAVYLERYLETMRLTEPGPSTDYAFVAGIIPFVDRITGERRYQNIAAAAAETVLSSNNAMPLVAMWARFGLIMEAVNSGNVDPAAEQYALLKPFQGTLISIYSSSADHLLGLLANTMGDTVQAMLHFQDALSFCGDAGYRPDLAWTCHDYAECLLERDGQGDHAKAIILLDESLAISSDLGMRPLTERVAALQIRAEAGPVRAPAYPAGLTRREIEVIRLVAVGKMDREIAEELIISVNTVGNHMRSILNKTNAANRTEAATYAVRHGLVPDEEIRE